MPVVGFVVVGSLVVGPLVVVGAAVVGDPDVVGAGVDFFVVGGSVLPSNVGLVVVGSRVVGEAAQMWLPNMKQSQEKNNDLN